MRNKLTKKDKSYYRICQRADKPDELMIIDTVLISLSKVNKQRNEQYKILKLFYCWRDGGHKEYKKDSKFNEMEGNLHNLHSSIGEVNGDRSNYRYS